MDGIWYKRCPQCSNYMQKADPRESCMCCSCGWEEYAVTTFYCEVIHKYCSYVSMDDGEKNDAVPPNKVATRS